ncbi:hypothetical protein MASR1M66_11630 [Aminivibrio sp.]
MNSEKEVLRAAETLREVLLERRRGKNDAENKRRHGTPLNTACSTALREIENDQDLDLQLIVTGSHLSPEFGNTIQEIKKDGLPIS